MLLAKKMNLEALIRFLPRPVRAHCENGEDAICGAPRAEEEHDDEHDGQNQREALDERNAEEDDAGDAQGAAGEHHLLGFCPKISDEVEVVVVIIFDET